MFFTFVRGFVQLLLVIINGNAKYMNRDRVPKDENYILVAPHRTWLDPVFMVIGARPKQFAFMAKQELFKNPVFGWLITKLGAFPINRDKPGPSTLKIPVKILKTGDKSLIMFPSGTRHSTELKGGVAVIAKMAKVKIVPCVYQGPLKISQLFLRKKIVMNYGEAIDVSDIKKLDNEAIAAISKRIEQAFKTLDDEIDPDYVYHAE
ncbi:MAG: 1-acyl-sn-glycerol-3-phosphate acyltransferase [Streptococcaceae bacterium]|jgi:1-acyl-sn-glycerol-3-phosphate acyltransferase|nr:1-acyl-sn-glycerol-3-phosphate acyltransferase [Streptococcaceae bacterium]